MELQQIRKGNIFNIDNGLMLRMRIKRFFIDNEEVDSVIVGSTTSLIENESACPISLLEGVPITEDILKDMGFEWDFALAYWIYDGLYIIDNGKMGFEAILTPRDFTLTVPIPYMHTLQNLYYSLKGKELPVKLAHFETEELQHIHTDYGVGISFPET